MSAARAEWLRQWHDDASAALHRRGAVDVEYLGLRLHVPEEVFSPTPTSDLLGRQVTARVRTGDRVLDMGCGSGANAILAARRAATVVAVDVNPAAVAATTGNAARHGVAGRVECKVSDLFDEIDGAFDVIVFDPPFRWFRPRDPLEQAITDERYRTLGRFFSEVSSRLTPRGEILLFFGTSGDVAHLDAVIERSGLRHETIAARVLVVRGEETTYFVRRITG